MSLTKGSIIQITDENHEWYPCILVISEVKDFGCQAYISVPLKGDAYIRLKFGEYEYVGASAKLTAQ